MLNLFAIIGVLAVLAAFLTLVGYVLHLRCLIGDLRGKVEKLEAAIDTINHRVSDLSSRFA